MEMIHIGEDYWILPDDYSIMIAKKSYVQSGKHKGDIRWTDRTYHATYQQLRSKVAFIAINVRLSKDTESMLSVLDNFALQEKEIKQLKPIKQ